MFSSFQLRKISVLLSREAQHTQNIRAGGCVAARGFVLQEGDGEKRWGCEQGLSCPGDASAHLVPLLGVELNVSSEPSLGVVH